MIQFIIYIALHQVVAWIGSGSGKRDWIHVYDWKNNLRLSW